MSARAPRFIEIDGKRYLWRDLVRLRQEQRAAARRGEQPAFCSSCARIAARRPSGRRRAAISNPPFLPSRSARESFPSKPPTEMIPLNKLVPSPANVRKTGALIGIEELGASVAATGSCRICRCAPARTASTKSWRVDAALPRSSASPRPDDALDHGRAVAAALSTLIRPPSAGGRRRNWRRPMSAKAARRAFIRAHNRRTRGRALRRPPKET
jgi:hypothetical protein